MTAPLQHNFLFLLLFKRSKPLLNPVTYSEGERVSKTEHVLTEEGGFLEAFLWDFILPPSGLLCSLPLQVSAGILLAAGPWQPWSPIYFSHYISSCGPCS